MDQAWRLFPSAPDAGLGQGVFTVDRDLGSGYAQQWNFAVQRELTKNMVVEVAYAGSKITHVGIPDTNINQLTAEPTRAGTGITYSRSESFLWPDTKIVKSRRSNHSRGAAPQTVSTIYQRDVLSKQRR